MIYIYFRADGTHALKLVCLNTCPTTYAVKFWKFNITILEEDVMIPEMNK